MRAPKPNCAGKVRMACSILFVCLGNICRSPTAAAIARKLFAECGLEAEIASAGTGNWHVGEGADPRAIRVARQHGYALHEHRGRQVEVADFARHDWILAMDEANLRALRALAPADGRAQVGLLLEVAGLEAPHEVPDPWFGEEAGFHQTVDLIERAIQELADRLARIEA